jgi:hypothetical protein
MHAAHERRREPFLKISHEAQRSGNKRDKQDDNDAKFKLSEDVIRGFIHGYLSLLKGSVVILE